MKKILFTLLIFQSLSASAIILEKCGEYQMKGEVQDSKFGNGLDFVINKNSKSEIRLKIINPSQNTDLIGLSEFPLEITGTIDKIDGMSGDLVEVKKVKTTFINHFHQDRSFKLITEKKCN